MKHYEITAVKNGKRVFTRIRVEPQKFHEHNPKPQSRKARQRILFQPAVKNMRTVPWGWQ